MLHYMFRIQPSQFYKNFTLMYPLPVLIRHFTLSQPSHCWYQIFDRMQQSPNSTSILYLQQIAFPNALPYLQPTVTRRTSGRSLGNFNAGKVPVSPP
jgi:hypothetical protein